MPIPHLEAPVGLRGVREEIEVEQVDTDRGFQGFVLPAGAHRLGEGAGQVVHAPCTPRLFTAHLHLDVVAPAVLVLGEDVQHDELAEELGGVDARVQHLDHLHGRILGAHRVDQRR